MRELLVMFATILIAELGDKTQIATVLFASEGKVRPVLVFAASASALIIAAALSVLVGAMASKFLAGVPIKLIAGIGFIVIGIWTVVENYYA